MAVIRVPASSGESSSESKHATKTITTDLLIPGRGSPQKDVAVTIRDGKIDSVRPIAELPETVRKETNQHVPVLLPGLWDCHCHYIGMTNLRLDNLASTHQALSGARCASDVRRTLMSGVTSCRELLGYGVQLAQAIKEGIIIGPNIYSAVAALSQTAGHADLHTVDPSVVQSFCNCGGPVYVCDGVEECRKGVRMQIRHGATVIKVMATGGVLSGIDDPHDAQFSKEELSVIVEEAAKTGRIVAAHCHGVAGILAALRAGCRTIEHGTYLNKEAIELMKEKGAMLVATRTILQEGIKHPETMTPESYAKMKETQKHHEKAYKLAVQSGVKIALGTDLGVSAADYAGLSHGNGGQELYWACQAGMTPLQAIECATANGPSTLGERYAPLSGQIKEGYDADLIGLSENPLEDMKLFTDPNNIKWVWKGGELFKSPSGGS